MGTGGVVAVRGDERAVAGERGPARDGYDVVVVGGGAAGLSATLQLARSRRSVLVVDAGEPRNAPAAAMHGFLGHDGLPPADLLARGRAEVRRYGAEVVRGRVDGAARDGSGFAVRLAGGREVGARRLLVATGLVDELPDVPGLRERWGRDVLHCPYCHGWEVRDTPVGVLGSPAALHQAHLFRQLTPDVVLFQHTAPAPGAAEREELRARGIRLVEGEVAGLVVAGDELTGVRMRSGEVVPRRALAVAPRFVARSAVLESLGAALSPLTVDGAVVAVQVEVDGGGLTSVPGVWAAGNVCDARAQVVTAAAAGAAAGARINADLAAEDVERAVAALRSPEPARAVG
nr:NAD(P)/FAD-dependent oxidoreductase [Kineococcus xinjiangensis]